MTFSALFGPPSLLFVHLNCTFFGVTYATETLLLQLPCTSFVICQRRTIFDSLKKFVMDDS